MSRPPLRRTLLLALPFLLHTPAHAQSRWAHFDPSGKLQYGHLQTGDHIADFSTAGYRGGGIAIPIIPAAATVSPSGLDDTTAIQRAIDLVSRAPLIDGRRGAVVLSKGIFQCSGTLHVRASGVVLRGVGATKDGTTIMMTGDPHLAIHIHGDMVISPEKATIATDSYIPSGTLSFHVQDPSGFKEGDTLLISKPITPAWVHFMGMDQLGQRHGKDEHWIKGMLQVLRQIDSVNGNLVTLQVPLLDSYDSTYLGTGAVTVTKVQVSGQVAETGVEDLRIVAP